MGGGGRSLSDETWPAHRCAVVPGVPHTDVPANSKESIMRWNLTVLIVLTVAASVPGSASADFTLTPMTSGLASCPPAQAWFAGACRDDSWVFANLGHVDAAAGVREENNDAPLRVLRGDSISWVAPVRVDAGAKKDTRRLDAGLVAALAEARGESEEWTKTMAEADQLMPTRHLPEFAVAVRAVDPDAVLGGFLIQRRVTTSVEPVGNGFAATLVEERLDLAAPGGPRLVEVQRLAFDPTLAFPACGDEGNCVLAYAYSPGCAEEMLAAAESEWVYFRTLVVGTLEEIVAARDAMAIAFAELHACLGLTN